MCGLSLAWVGIPGKTESGQKDGIGKSDGMTESSKSDKVTESGKVTLLGPPSEG